MNIQITGKNWHVADSTKEFIKKKLEKIEKFFQSEVEAHVVLSNIRQNHVAEVTIPLKNKVIIRAEEIADTSETAIERAVDKLIRQIRKHKTNIQKRFRKNESIRFEFIPEIQKEEFENLENEEQKLEIIRTKHFTVKPMSTEEAVLQLDMVGHNFYVFLDEKDRKINVVYKRRDGKFGLITPKEE